MISADTSRRDRVMANAEYFRKRMTEKGFDLAGSGHPIIPVMLYDAKLSADVADFMLDQGIYVTGFYYPVVPKGKARIRTQMSAAHTFEDIDRCVDAFVAAREKFGF